MAKNKPLDKIQPEHKKAKLIVFDLDGTITASKTDLDEEMAGLLDKLLKKKMIAVISGGRFEQFQKQFLSILQSRPVEWSNLFLFPTSATSFYCYIENGWQEIYAELLSKEEKKRVFKAFEKTFQELNYNHPEKIYGELIEDRETQITFSALGQKAPLDLKLKWKEEHTEDKMKIVETMQKYLPDLEVRAGGYTSVDITHQGVDKGYGLKQIKKHLGINFDEMLFVGDALFPGGNDSAVLRTSVPCFEVKGPEETKELIKSLL